MNNINELYELWLEKATADPDLKEELLSIKGKEDEILDRFYRSLEFGTAGLRGVIGAGTNRMNYYTVGRATQGLADFLNKHFEHPSIAIGYDSRIKSDYFSIEAAKILAANNITKSLNLHLAFRLQSGILKHQAVLFSPHLTIRLNITVTNAITKTAIR